MVWFFSRRSLIIIVAVVGVDNDDLVWLIGIPLDVRRHAVVVDNDVVIVVFVDDVDVVV